MTSNPAVVDDPFLNQAIGEVVTALAVTDELMRTVLASLTGLQTGYILFEGQGTGDLIESTKTLLGEYVMYGPQRGGFDEVKRQLSLLDNLKNLRNDIVHGTWHTSDLDFDSTRLRPWKDKSLDNTELYYCTISKRRKMTTQQPMTIDDIRDVATRIRDCTALLAKAADDTLRIIFAGDHPTGLLDEWK